MWDNREDARMRLSGCVVMYDGEPVKVVDIDEDCVAHIYLIGDEDSLFVPIDDEAWDWVPVKTGYYNPVRAGSAAYVSRRPRRRWKQGLHPDNLYLPKWMAGRADLIYTNAFKKTIMGQYPSYEEVVTKIKTKVWKSKAFSRQYAITKSDLGIPLLSYRGENVGWYEGDHAVLGEGWDFLREDFNEAREGANG